MKSLILLLVIALVSSESNLRNLAFNYNCDKTWTLKSFNVLGHTITFKEKVGVRGGKAYNQIIISSDTGSFSFGNSGVTAPISKTTSFSTTVFRFPLATLPAFYISIKASGSIKYSVKESSGKLTLTLSGTIYAQAEGSGIPEGFISISASGKGTMLNISRTYIISSSNAITKSGNISGGTVSINITGKLINMTVFNKDYTLWNGWSA